MTVVAGTEPTTRADRRGARTMPPNGVRARLQRPVSELVLLIGIVVIAIPVLWVWIASIRPQIELVSRSLSLNPSLINYETVFGPGSTVVRMLVNSGIIVLGTVALTLFVGCLGAYALSKFRWPKWVTVGLLGGILFIELVPPVSIMPAAYTWFVRAGLYDSLLALILWNTIFHLPFAVLLVKTYFDDLPDELIEAARVDGAPDSLVFRRIALPLAIPGIVTVAIFVAILSWNEFLMASVITASPAAQPITVGIAGYVQEHTIEYGSMTAVATVASLPMIIVLAFGQRYIMSGLTSGALKG